MCVCVCVCVCVSDLIITAHFFSSFCSIFLNFNRNNLACYAHHVLQCSG